MAHIENKTTSEDQYRFAVTTHDDLWLENITITSTDPITATNQAVESISTPEYENFNGRGCKVLLTGINVDENGEWH